MKTTVFSYAILLAMVMTCCKKKEENPLDHLHKDLVAGRWKITELMIDNRNLTPGFQQYRLTFSPEKAPESPMEYFNRLIVTDGENQVQGTWIFTHANREEPYKYYLSVAFVSNESFQPLSARWGIESYDRGNLRLVKLSEELSPEAKVMVLMKE